METQGSTRLGALARRIQALRSNPRYTAMRGIARFQTVRTFVIGIRGAWQMRRRSDFLRDCESRFDDSVFQGVLPREILDRLREDGIAFGLDLPHRFVESIREFAEATRCYADRVVSQGFYLKDRSEAERKLRKPILVAQYFNARQNCPAIDDLVRDPILNWIAGSYMESVPKFVGTNLWWTFPVNASEEDRDKHAHRFHRDIDDFRFLKFFFYLTDVREGDGAHVIVTSSRSEAPSRRMLDKWRNRRYADSEVLSKFGAARIKEVLGAAGSGFAEDTSCIHKGLTPTVSPRLLLQLQFALFDYGVTGDERPDSSLKSLI